MKRKVPVRLLSFLLAGVLTVSSVQMPVYASEAAVDQETDAGGVTGEGTSEGKPDIEDIEIEEADLSTEQAPESAPGDTVAEDDADPGDFDAVLPETEASGESGGITGSGETGISEDIESSESEEDTDAEAEEEGEISDSGETVYADGDTTTTYEISGAPKKRIYLLGTEMFERDGIQIKEQPGNKTVDISLAEVSGYNSSSEGEQTVVVSYQGTTASFKVLVIKVPELEADFGKSLSDVTFTNPTYGNWTWADDSQKLNQTGKQKYKVNFMPTSSDYPTGRSGIDATVEVKCDLDRADVSVALTGISYDDVSQSYYTTYNGKRQQPKAVVTVGGITLPSTNYKEDYVDNLDAGEASVQVKGIGDYCTGTNDIGFSIRPIKIKIKMDNQTVYFGRLDDVEPQLPTYTHQVVGLLPEDKDKVQIDVEADCDCKEDDLYAISAYPIRVIKAEITEGSAAGNYELDADPYIDGTLYVEKITLKPVSISGVSDGIDKEYDKKKWSYAEAAKVVDANKNTVSGVRAEAWYSGTMSDGTEYDSSEAPSEAGEYTVTFKLTGKDWGVYSLAKDSFEFKITRKVITITAKSYKVAAGELVPEITDDTNELIVKLVEKYKAFYDVDGFLKEDKNDQDNILDTVNLSLRYDEGNISADKAGTFDIIPYGAAVKGTYQRNYEISYVNGKLDVEGKHPFQADFSSIVVKNMTYNSKKHSISGYATGIPPAINTTNAKDTYTIIIIGETRNEEYADTEGWEKGDDPDDPEGENEGKYNYRRKYKEVSPADIVEKYHEIAPTEVGNYTLKIFSDIDQRTFAYDGKALLKISFKILPLQKNETKLVGVAGVTNKIYDGEITDLSEAIRNAKVWTKQDDVDITKLIEGNKKLKFWIKGYTPAGSEDDKTGDEEGDTPEDGEGDNVEESPFKDRNYYLSDDFKDKMPVDAGEYELVVRIEADESQNYVTNEWSFPFVIKPRPLTLTVNDVKIPVNADGELPDPASYEYTITDDTITDEEKEDLSDDFTWLHIGIAPLVTVDTSKPGSYDLVATSNIDDKDKRKGNNYEIDYVPGKLFVQAQLCGVKKLNLTNNKNIPHGTTLEEIADKYLPKTIVIYLNEDWTVEDKATVEWQTDKPSAGVYRIDGTSVQNFKMKGTVILPDLVGETEKSREENWLTVEVDISVREPDDGTRAMKPYANIKSGTVGAGTRVSLYTDEEGAEIYYTVEADNPSLSVASRLYTGPIEVQCTMTVRAVARIYGKLDSEELRLNYYYNKNYKPGGPDDPNDPSGPQVPDEDIPKDEDGKPLDIPKGMWVTDVEPYTYTGTAIKPQVRVYDYKTRLEENKDYTISYKNNVNAADKNDPKKAPSIVIKGKGNYEGTINKTFTIAPKDINDMHEENGRKVYDVKMDDITVAYAEKKAQKPVVAVSWNGKKLVNKKDYIYEAYPYTAVGTYAVTVTGNGNYKGERQISFTITNALPASLFTVEKIADYNYTGQEIKPMVVVMYQKAVVSPGLEYDVSYEDNVEIGTASVVIKGKGRFAGVKRVNFKIKVPAMLNKADVELVFGSGTVYTGSAVEPSEIKIAVQVNNNGAVSTKVLTKDDYKVTYQNNVKAGTATAVFEGAGVYKGTGTLKKTFKITPYNIQNLQPEQITVRPTYPYMKGGSAQKPVVQFDGKTLQEGTDYTLSYKNNTKVGNTAVVTIKGKGNFTGSVMRTYQVTVQDISNAKVVPADKVYKAAAGNYKTTVRVLDTNGKALSAGKDYDKNVVYTYAERTALSSGVVKDAGDPVGALDMLPVGTRLRVTVTAVGSDYQGTAMGMFTIVQADVAKAKVIVPTMTYTGKAIEPKKSEIVVTLNGIPLAAGDYQITGYSNNLNTGTAKLTIQGQGNYGGTKTVSFKIKKKSLIAQLFG